MDNAQKAIMIGVGLFITIIIISAVLLITNMGTDIIDEAAGEVGNLSDTLKNEMVKAYDGKTLNGTQMLDCIEKYYGHKTMGLQVKIEEKTYKFTYVGMALPSAVTADDYKAGGIVATNVFHQTADVMTSYGGIVTKIAASDTFKTTLVYNGAGRLLGIAAIKI